jgi:hypothetical protein
VAWYRRRLCLQDAVAISDGSKHSWLEFEGVMVKSKALEGLRKYAEIRVGKAAVCGYSNFSQSESIRECGS